MRNEKSEVSPVMVTTAGIEMLLTETCPGATSFFFLRTFLCELVGTGFDCQSFTYSYNSYDQVGLTRCTLMSGLGLMCCFVYQFWQVILVLVSYWCEYAYHI